jgi:hypothetical protein
MAEKTGFILSYEVKLFPDFIKCEITISQFSR